MPKPNAAILSIMSGFALLTALPGCAHRTVEVPVEKPAAVAVPVVAEPPADLTRCADRPAGIPEDPALIAQIPTRVRAAIIGIARAFAANANQLDRLVNWHRAGSCPAR